MEEGINQTFYLEEVEVGPYLLGTENIEEENLRERLGGRVDSWNLERTHRC